MHCTVSDVSFSFKIQTLASYSCNTSNRTKVYIFFCYVTSMIILLMLLRLAGPLESVQLVL